ncbi:MAG: hypothetical protein K2W82_03280 [Candidatus Obscuribacterales bacterium]|nr:hypothetical protein [Candidatus Obscuribacterales bacterium]
MQLERPALFRICNAIRTIDFAIGSGIEESQTAFLSREVWSQIRNQLFRLLLTSFPGYFLVYDENSSEPLDAGSAWPENGRIEFYPEKILRRFETYKADFEQIDPEVLTYLRWCFGQDRQNIDPSIFTDLEAQAKAAGELLDRLYEICEQEAAHGKRKAHHKWWQLYWQANSCTDKRQRHDLQKQMVDLQSVWGRPASVSS